MPTPSGPDGPASFRLHALMAAHTLIVAVSIAAIAYLIWRGVAGGSVLADRIAWAALAWPAAIGLGRYLNGVECILQTLAKRWRGVDSGWARDVYWLPERFAMAIPSTFTPLYLLGAGLVIGRGLEQLGRSV